MGFSIDHINTIYNGAVTAVVATSVYSFVPVVFSRVSGVFHLTSGADVRQQILPTTVTAVVATRVSYAQQFITVSSL